MIDQPIKKYVETLPYIGNSCEYFVTHGMTGPVIVYLFSDNEPISPVFMQHMDGQVRFYGVPDCKEIKVVVVGSTFGRPPHQS